MLIHIQPFLWSYYGRKQYLEKAILPQRVTTNHLTWHSEDQTRTVLVRVQNVHHSASQKSLTCESYQTLATLSLFFSHVGKTFLAENRIMSLSYVHISALKLIRARGFFSQKFMGLHTTRVFLTWRNQQLSNKLSGKKLP